MHAKKLDGVEVWKELEDNLAPRLKLNPIDRAVYANLLRHTRLEGKLRRRFTIAGVALQLGISRGPVRKAMRRLASHGVVRLHDRSYGGYVVEVRLPCEVRSAKSKKGRVSKPEGERNLEEINFLNTTKLRQAIHAREDGRCFYCRKRVSGGSRCLDHVVPSSEFGQNSYRNLVSCCPQCNWQKKDQPAPDFLRELFRDGRLSHKELTGRLRALQALAAGKLRPVVAGL